MTDMTEQQKEALEALDRVSIHLRRGDPISTNDILNDIERVRDYVRNSIQVSENWQLLPVEPTARMMTAFWLAGPYPKKPWRDGYRAILEAAPNPQWTEIDR